MNIFDKIAKHIGDNIGILFLFCAILSAYELCADKIFNSPTIWVYDCVMILLGVCFAFGGPYAEQANEHVRISFAYNLATPRVKFCCDVVSGVITLIFCFGLLWPSSVQAINALLTHETSGRAWDSPMPQIIRSALALAALLLTLQLISRFVALLRAGFNPRETSK